MSASTNECTVPGLCILFTYIKMHYTQKYIWKSLTTDCTPSDIHEVHHSPLNDHVHAIMSLLSYCNLSSSRERLSSGFSTRLHTNKAAKL